MHAGSNTGNSPLTVDEVFRNTCQSWPQRPFLNTLPETAGIYGIDAGELSYQQALLAVDTLVAALRAAGFVAGERIMLLLENRPAFFLYWLAMNRLGISVVPVNPELRHAELAYLIGHAEPSLAISLPSHSQLLGDAAASIGYPLAIMQAGADFPDQHQPRPAARTDRDPASREAAMLYTSGTTGKPKGCVLSNTYFLLAGQWYAGASGLCTLSSDGERMITPLPLFHMNAMACSFMAMLTVGGCLTVLDRFHPRSWWHSVRSSRASCLHYLGVMPTLLMAAPAEPDELNHNVRFGFGAGIDPALHQAFEQRFGFPLVEAWAMTETGAGAVIAANREPRKVGVSSFGRPADEIEIKLIDDQRQNVARGTPGELLVRRAGSNPRYGFFSEYHKDPQATEAAWQDGWFNTGDLVRETADGDLIFVDRKKNIIRRSGENIAAVEVESVLLQHPLINAVGVAAVPDSVREEEVFACLQINVEPSQTLALEIVDWCLQQMAYYKAPAYIAFVDALPLTATQKIQRKELRSLANALLQESTTICTAELKKRQHPA